MKSQVRLPFRDPALPFVGRSNEDHQGSSERNFLVSEKMSQWILTTRNQFTFKADDHTIACISTLSSAHDDPCLNIDVVGSFVVSANSKKSLVKVVVGSPEDPLDSNTGEETARQNKLFRKYLEKLCVKYTEDEVIQLFNIDADTGTHGGARKPFTALYCADIPICASYIGLPARGFTVSVFYEVPSGLLKDAIRALLSIDICPVFDEDQLCVNIDNVEEVCGVKTKKLKKHKAKFLRCKCKKDKYKCEEAHQKEHKAKLLKCKCKQVKAKCEDKYECECEEVDSCSDEWKKDSSSESEEEFEHHKSKHHGFKHYSKCGCGQ